MTEHSVIGFSSRARWAACPGSVRLSLGVESTTSEHAEEGTLAHALQEACLHVRILPTRYVGKVFEYEDHGERKSAVISSEMAAYLTPHIEEILDHTSTPGMSMWVESRVNLSSIHPALFGTADVIIYDPSTQTLTIRDLKYGAGVAVFPTYPDGRINPQLEGYALGAVYALSGKIGAINSVVVIIDQPRVDSNAPRRAEFDILDFLGSAHRLGVEAHAVDCVDAPLSQGEHCRWCPAAFKCPLLAKTTEDFMRMTEEYPQDSVELAEALDFIPAIETRIKSLRQYAYTQSIKGNAIPGYKLVEKRANRRWVDEESAISFLESKGVHPYQEPKMITPPVAEKLLSKTERPELNELCIRESSGSTLVREEDGRPEKPKVPSMPPAE